MLMAADSMSVAVGDFLLAGGAYGDYFYIKYQLLSRQRVVGVDIRAVAACFDHSDAASTLVRIQLHRHSRAKFAAEEQVFYRYPLLQIVAAQPVGLLWRQVYTQGIAAGMTFQRCLQAANDVIGPVQVAVGVPAVGAFQFFASTVTENIVKADDCFCCNLHVVNQTWCGSRILRGLKGQR